MANLTPIRDDAGNIVGLGPREKPGGFAALLADTMTAVGAKQEQAEPPARRPFGRFEAAAVVCGLVVAVVLIVLVNRVTPTQEAPRAPVRPTVAQSTPASAAVPVVAPTATPESPTPTEAPPTQTPVVVIVEQACYSVTQDVYAGSRPLGTVTGQSCESQETAQAAADQLAAEMRGNP